MADKTIVYAVEHYPIENRKPWCGVKPHRNDASPIWGLTHLNPYPCHEILWSYGMNRNDARKIIDGLMIEYPTLTSSGWGQVSNEKFQGYRDQLGTEFFVDEFLHAM